MPRTSAEVHALNVLPVTLTVKPLDFTAAAKTAPPLPVRAMHDAKFDEDMATSLSPTTAPPFVRASHETNREVLIAVDWAAYRHPPSEEEDVARVRTLSATLSWPRVKTKPPCVEAGRRW